MGLVIMEVKVIACLFLLGVCMVSTTYAIQCYQCSNTEDDCKDHYDKPLEDRHTCTATERKCHKTLTKDSKGKVTAVERGCAETCTNSDTKKCCDKTLCNGTTATTAAAVTILGAAIMAKIVNNI